MALIALGVTGGIGAYKAVEVCRGLQKRGHDVVAVMTRAATRFVGPITFEAITRRPVITSQWKPGANADIEHIAIADEIALLLVAPCTANVIGKFANGIADDFLTSLYLATKAPVLIAPAMNSNMLAHDAVQRNLQTLAARGTKFVEPGDGYLACGWIGKGRLAEPDDIVAAAERIVSPRDSALRGRRVVVTAGPTYEDIDPVRYVGNRSSGRMGFAIASAAHARGANVTLVAGPTSVEPPATDEVIKVRRAAEMHAAVMRAAEHADVVIMAAAVADYAPVNPASDKIAKSHEPLTLTLQRTPDILADLGQASARRATPVVLVGFAAETSDLLAKARDKRARKNVDLIVANDITAPGAGFDVETNAVTIIGADREETLPVQSKTRVAEAILDRIEQLLESRAAATAR
ncbi:MAG: bifunctional phosphopantothenoylcysteine decarboxylase/phosphopantothenate--cysteine ligase CoaBC [Acidobacteria bacterium]|nr:MAG: bifunctional phosphopantothenoylcysteine decarboxylase/phosphopantothenate--cysteine ligase CoaBC [Acidobacteriota bacterium]